MEREHERDEFQQEIKNLEAQLRVPSKGQTGGQAKCQRVSNMTPSKTIRMSCCWRESLLSSHFKIKLLFVNVLLFLFIYPFPLLPLTG